MITSQYLCPCQCGETVEVTDKGFEATEVTMAACTTQAASGAISFQLRKSALLELTPASETRLVRHTEGLLAFQI